MKLPFLAYDLCRCYVNDSADVGSELKNKVLGFLRARNLSKLTQVTSIFQEHCQNLETRRFLMQVEAFFKKNAAFADKVKTESAALESFRAAEVQCRETNVRLDRWEESEWANHIRKMQNAIEHVLGCPRLFLDVVPESIRLTDGATSHDSRRRSLPYMKVRKKYYTTPGGGGILRALFQFFELGKVSTRQTSFNRVVFVPKNWKTCRTIACEPTGTLPFQLAFDHYCKSRLRTRAGIDLRDQSLNQTGAEEGSIDGSLATLDLSAASDSLAMNAVHLLFPVDWARILFKLRSPAYILPDGTKGVYHKFASMGNGMTFSLETLVFWAACKAVGSRKPIVYGDDIIVETDLADDLVALLAFLGFTVNGEKSYFEGPFRESCGVNFYKGIDITPVYIRDQIDDPSVLSHIVNSLSRYAYPGSSLGEFLRLLVRSHNLLLVPWQEDTTAGIWIDIPTAYRLRKLRSRNGELTQLRYSTKKKRRRVSDIRTYMLWHLWKFSRPLRVFRFGSATEVPLPTHKYVRRVSGWFPPAKVPPVHLYWWTDFLTDKSVS